MLFAVISIVFVACNNATKSKTETAEKTEKSCCDNKVSVDSFLIVAENFVGKEMIVFGTVDHVCKHGGKRVKMFSSCPSKTIHAEAAEGMGQFKAEVEGSDICVTGIVAEHKMDLAYVEEYETKIKEAMKTEAEEVEMEHEKGADHHATLEKINNWKEEINSNGKGYISTYYLEVSKYHEMESKDADCDHKHDEAHEHAEATPCCKGKKDGEAKTEEKPCDHGHTGH